MGVNSRVLDHVCTGYLLPVRLAGYPAVFAIRFWFLTSRNVELHRMSQMDILLSITTLERKCYKI